MTTMTEHWANSSPGRYDANVLERILVARHSCRGFKSDRLPRSTIERILSAAQRSASWCNAQPWQVLVTSGEETELFKRALCEHVAREQPQPDIPFPGEYRGVYLQR